jgi:alanyl-tRNA synthetase
MRKLFYENSHLQEFTARVTGCRQTEKGWLVTLDATAFYPEGGGQACDIGTLGGVNVLDVREKENEILHLCDGALEVGSEVFGKIDWQHRFDLMQQHTGEHIVSGLLHEKFGYHNTGFHVGKNVMEVDFDGPISPEDLAQIERRANEAIWANLPVKCWIPEPEELPSVTYRTKRELPWPVRIVQVPGYDSCACCGIHVAHTGEVGMIKILTCVKFHGGIRLEMVCGNRAYRYMTEVFEQNRLVSQTFSAKILETGEAARKMQEALTTEKLRAANLQKQVFENIAAGFAEKENVLYFADALERGERCRKLYMSCELLPDGRQSALLAQYGVQVHSVPDYYYQEAEEG